MTIADVGPDDRDSPDRDLKDILEHLVAILNDPAFLEARAAWLRGREAASLADEVARALARQGRP